jgi:hypothetical protein
MRKEKIDSIIKMWERKVIMMDDDCKEVVWQGLEDDIDNMLSDFEDAKKEKTAFEAPEWMSANPDYKGTTVKEWKALLSWVRVQMM